jgi:hypothetical protein
VDADASREHVRRTALALPEVIERPTHGHPGFFVRGSKLVCSIHETVRGDGRPAMWCKAPPGAQEHYVAAEPDRYFVPPYVGHAGWLGVRLDSGLPAEDLTGAIEDSYALVAPKALVARAVEQARLASD